MSNDKITRFISVHHSTRSFFISEDRYLLAEVKEPARATSKAQSTTAESSERRRAEQFGYGPPKGADRTSRLTSFERFSDARY